MLPYPNKPQFFSVPLPPQQQHNWSQKTWRRILDRCLKLSTQSSKLPPSVGWLTTMNRDDCVIARQTLLDHGGPAMAQALEQLEWGKNPDDLKLIFIAGNEPFTQGPVSYAEACKKAIEMGIIINTIHNFH